MFGGYNPKNPKNLENAQTDQTSSFQSNYEEMEDQPWTTAQSAVDRCRCRCNEIYDKLKLKLKLSLLDETNETRSKSREENDSNQGFFHFGERCRILEEQTQKDREQIEYLTSELNKRNGENEMLERKLHELSSNPLFLRNKDEYDEKLQMVQSLRERDKLEFERDKRRLEEELEICKNETEDEKLEKEKFLREIDQLRQRATVEDQMRDILRERDEALRLSQALESQIDHANTKAAKLTREKDDAIDEMHAYQLQEKECRNEISRLKRDIDKLCQGTTMEDQMRDILRERDEALQQLKALESQANTQAAEHASEKEHALNRMRIQIQASEKELSQLKRERDNSCNENQAYKVQDEEMRNEILNLRSERDSARQEVKEYKKKVEDANIQISKLRDKEKSATDQNSKVTLDSEARIKKLVAEIQSLKSEQEHLQRINRKVIEDNSRYKRQVNELVKAKDDALTRLSKVAGAKLTQGNAAITDLSDDNRPTKISEKFSELYDNAWTDAFEDIECLGIDEREGIDILLAVLKKTFELCSQVEDKYEEKILQAVRTIPSVFQSEGFKDCTVKTNIQVIKSLCEIRLSMENDCSLAVERMILSYLPNFLQTLSTKFDVSNTPSKLVHYTRSCTRLCWLMRVRDPPLHLQFDIQSDGPFTQDYFRQYTKSGKNVDYMVWPVLFLHKNGPLLAKGVAQPK